MKKIILVIAAALAGCMLSAKVRLPEIIGDNMVLQQCSKACLWGWADAGAKVNVSASWGATATAKADAKGAWKVYLDTPAASYEQRTITIRSGEEVTLHNILIGEVWMGCGQSNMEMPMQGFTNCPVDGAWEEITTANKYRGKIRHVKIPITETAYEPRETVPGKWEELDCETAVNLSATGYYFCKMMSAALDVPIGFIACNRGGSRVESWLPKDILDAYGEPTDRASIVDHKPFWERQLVYYNGMLYPLRNYTIKGFLWYQGESNTSTYTQYKERLSKMIETWRGLFAQGELPFYLVEIAPYHVYGGLNGARLREAQWQVADSVPNTGAIGTNDLVEPYEKYQIHPKNKKDVGFRLAWMALNRTYGMHSAPSVYPRYKSHRVEGNRVIVDFDNLLWYGYNRMSDISGFELCGADGVFHPARAYVDNNALVVESAEVPAPVHVRYCFHDFAPGNLGSGLGLPVIPFRTDNYNDR